MTTQPTPTSPMTRGATLLRLQLAPARPQTPPAVHAEAIATLFIEAERNAREEALRRRRDETAAAPAARYAHD